ncbi:hypothetical protein VN1175_08520 [Helicobacter pylori]|nr:hypothetical protein VN1175_08520 [Helicobacter pylori]GHR83365.1 hypothetical protein VN0664_03180 [Helicobacter pylori]
MKADTQPIFKALWGIAQEESEGYKQAAEGYKKALEAKEKAYKIVNILKVINHDNNIIVLDPEDEKD